MIINLVLTVIEKKREEKLISLYEAEGCTMALSMPVNGTATRALLASLGLEVTEKSMVFGVLTGDKSSELFRSAKKQLQIDIPGNGVMMAMPIKTVGGGRSLAYLTDGAAWDDGRPDMNYDHELIMIVLNQGYTDDVMDAARAAGAGGGTVLHAKGTGAKYAEKFLGLSLTDEKEIIMIVADTAEKTAIMKAVAASQGPGTPAGAICFSLPVSEVAGLRARVD